MDLLRFWLAFIGMLWMGILSAQPLEENYGGKATLAPVPEDGFYRIPITPDWRKYLGPDLSDIRLVDAEGGTVPFALEEPPLPPLPRLVRKLEILEQNSHRGGGGTVILEDPEQGSLPGLALEVDHGQVSRDLSIYGSFDQKKWELLGERHLYAERFHDGTRRFLLRDLEAGSHRFYKVTIGAEGMGLDPKILEADAITQGTDWKGYAPLPLHDAPVRRKEEHTFIDLHFDTSSYYLHGIQLDLEEKGSFFREGFLARKDTTAPEGYEKLQSFDIVSYGEHRLVFKGYRTHDLMLVIRDRGNLPLHIKGVEAFQEQRYMIARLPAGGGYKVLFGKKGTQPLPYDLPHYHDQISGNTPLLEATSIHWEGGYPEKTPEQKTPDSGTDLLTIVMVMVFVALFIYGSYRVVRKVLRSP